MKKMMITILALTFFTTGAFANNEEVRADLLRAQALIDSALEKLDSQQDIRSSRRVSGAQFICRETATSLEVTAAVRSLKEELQARCGQRCTVVLEFKTRGSDCEIGGAAYPNR